MTFFDFQFFILAISGEDSYLSAFRLDLPLPAPNTPNSPLPRRVFPAPSLVSGPAALPAWADAAVVSAAPVEAAVLAAKVSVVPVDADAVPVIPADAVVTSADAVSVVPVDAAAAAAVSADAVSVAQIGRASCRERV